MVMSLLLSLFKNTIMHHAKKNIAGKTTMKESSAQQDVKPSTSASIASAFPSGSEIHEHLWTQLRIHLGDQIFHATGAKHVHYLTNSLVWPVLSTGTILRA